MDLEVADASMVVGTLPPAAERCTSDGILHGGAIMALADTVGAICAYRICPTERPHRGSNPRRTSSAACAQVSCEQSQSQRTLGIAQSSSTDLLDDQDRSVALVIQSLAVLQRA